MGGGNGGKRASHLSSASSVPAGQLFQAKPGEAGESLSQLAASFSVGSGSARISKSPNVQAHEEGRQDALCLEESEGFSPPCPFPTNLHVS